MTSILPRCILVLLIALSCQQAPAAADEPVDDLTPLPESRQRSRRIEIAASETTQLLRLPLDTDFWMHTRPGFPDVAVINDHHQMIPFLIRQTPGLQSFTTPYLWTPQQIELLPEDDGALSLIVRLADTDPQPELLRIQTPLQDFEQRVEVTDETTTPAMPLCEPTLIFDYTRFMDVRRMEVPLQKTTGRILKIRIETATAELESPLRELISTVNSSGQTEQSERSLRVRRPFRIDRITFQSTSVTQSSIHPEARPLEITEVREDPVQRTTTAEFLSDQRPITKVLLQTPARNFRRRVTVQVPAQHQPEKWQDTADGVISNFTAGTLSEQQLELSLPELRTKRLRIVIQNLDSPPLPITGATGIGPQYELLLLTEPGQSYQLLYDDDQALQPQHDLQALNRAIQLNTPTVTATLLPVVQRQLRPKQPVADAGQKLLNSPWLLGIVSLVSATLLGWSLYNAIRRLEADSQGPPDSANPTTPPVP